MRGASLLETLVVVGLIAMLSLTGVNTINNFRKEASLDNAANEFVSAVREARNMSMNGILLPGETADDFANDGLPEYGISVYNGSYSLIRQCLRVEGGNCSGEIISNTTLNSDHQITPGGSFFFKRITGSTLDRSIMITHINGKDGRQIDIRSNAVIEVAKF